VPQNRDRIILIGFRNNLIQDLGIKLSNKDNLLLDYFPWDKYAIYPKNQVFSWSWPTTNLFQEDSIIPCPAHLPQELTVEYWFQKNDVLNHPNAQHFFKPRAGIKRLSLWMRGMILKSHTSVCTDGVIPLRLVWKQ
jgi:DNA (cytosine-5)-methyltransferase 1